MAGRPELRLIPFKPGVRKDDTAYSAEGQWTDADKTRFVRGYVESYAGTEYASPDSIIGRCRFMHAWADLTGLRYLALGTSCQLAVYYSGSIIDITPFETGVSGGLSGPFSTTAGSDIVTVASPAHGQQAGDTVYLGPTYTGPTIAVTAGSPTATVTIPNHGLANGDIVTFNNVTPFAGVAVIGEYTISNVLANTFDISVQTATATATGGGAPATASVVQVSVGDLYINGGYKIQTAAANSYTIKADKPATATATGGGLIGYLYGRRAMAANAFTTTIGLNSVNVNIVGHNRSIGDRVIFNGVAAFNGVTIDGEYSVDTVVDADNFTILVQDVATASGAGGGAAATYIFLLKCGNVDGLAGYGYGTGGYGNGPYGIGASSRDKLYPRTWSGGNFGDTLICAPRGEKLYQWRPTLADTDFPRAVLVPNAPPEVNAVTVTAERFVACAGTFNAAMVYEPMVTRWSDRENFNNWAPQPNNDAGELLAGDGSALIQIRPSREQTLVWSDTGVYGLQPSADSGVVYSLTQLGTGCGLIGPNATARIGGMDFWCGSNRAFWAYSGGMPRQITCPNVRWFFDNLATSQQDKIYAATYGEKSEVTWYFPATPAPDNLPDVPALENNRYLSYNFIDDVWSVGTYDRTAVIDAGVFENPYGTSSAVGDKRLWIMELGTGINGNAWTCYAESAPFDTGDGDKTTFIDRVVLDSVIDNGGYLQFYLIARKFPNSTPVTYGPENWNANTEYRSVRVEGRQVALRVESIDGVTFWRLGNVRMATTDRSRRTL